MRALARLLASACARHRLCMCVRVRVCVCAASDGGVASVDHRRGGPRLRRPPRGDLFFSLSLPLSLSLSPCLVFADPPEVTTRAFMRSRGSVAALIHSHPPPPLPFGRCWGRAPLARSSRRSTAAAQASLNALAHTGDIPSPLPATTTTYDGSPDSARHPTRRRAARCSSQPNQPPG